MTITIKKPAYKITVGNAYFADVNPDAAAGAYQYKTTEGVESIKEIGVSLEKAESTIYASGITYDVTQQKTGESITVDAVQLPKELIRKYLGEVKPSGDRGGVSIATTDDKAPEFAFGYSVEYSDGNQVFRWYPRCKLIAADETAATRDESASDPSDSYEIMAMPLDELICAKYDQSQTTGGAVTEAEFFEKVVSKVDTLIGS